jgi:hypothetical protein
MSNDNIHPLLIRGAQLTEKVWTWTIKDHPHTVAGSCRGFEVRVYHHPASGWDPYLIALVSTKDGWVMDSTYAMTAAAAESEAQELLDHLTQRHPRTFTTADLDKTADHKDRVERLTRTLLAAINAAGATPAQAKHALTRTLGVLIGSRAQSDADRDVAISIASSAIAGCAKDAALAARHGHDLRPKKSILN